MAFKKYCFYWSLTEEPDKQASVTRLHTRYSDLIGEVTQLFSEKELSCNDIVKYIMSLPPERIGEHYNFVMPHIVDSTAHSRVYEFMQKLRMYMQFLDCRLLKKMITHFAKDLHPSLLKKMESYETDIEDFCQNTTITGFANNCQAEENVPEHFTTLQVKHSLDPNRLDQSPNMLVPNSWLVE